MNNKKFQMNNCAFEIVKVWLMHEKNIYISDSHLFLACCNIGFEYKSEKSNKNGSFPKIEVLQSMDTNSLLDCFGIHVSSKNIKDPEQAWLVIRNELLSNRIAFVRGVVSLLPNHDNDKTVTFFAIDKYIEEKKLVNISSFYYNGLVTIDMLRKMREEISHFGEPPNSWVTLHADKLPELNDEKICKLLVRNVNNNPKLLDDTMSNLILLKRDINLFEQLNPILLKIIITNLSKQLFHPLSPPSTRKQLLFTVMKLNKIGKLSETCLFKCENLVNEWEKMKQIFAKETVKSTGNFIERVSIILENIIKLEYDSLNQIIKETKELEYEV